MFVKKGLCYDNRRKERFSQLQNNKIKKDFGKFYSTLFDLRYTGDYDDFIDSTKEQVLDLLQPSVNLIMKIELIINESDNEDQ